MGAPAVEGYVDAQLYLANYLRNPFDGAKKDDVSAYAWLWLSAENGFEAAKKEKEKFAKELSPKQIAEAEKLAKEMRYRQLSIHHRRGKHIHPGILHSVVPANRRALF